MDGNTPLNRSALPYNPALSNTYNCHTTTAISSSNTALKYLDKYVYKEHHPTYFQVRLRRSTELM